MQCNNVNHKKSQMRLCRFLKASALRHNGNGISAQRQRLCGAKPMRLRRKVETRFTYVLGMILAMLPMF